MLARLPFNQAARLEALRRYDILDTPVEAEFDEITDLIARVCDTPIAVINFIDDGRQWFKSEIGLGVRETPLDISICAHAILQPGLFIVHDTLEDDRFNSNPLVTGDPRLRFYAGALLETPDRHPLGTLCVLDYKPRVLTLLQQATLRTLARQVMTQLELRRANAALAERVEAAVTDRRKAEDALRQAQKMEAIGQLTGGIAHDFNNMLMVLIGSLETVERRLPTKDPDVDKALARAFRSADRAAMLTHRLLAFAHRQEVQTRSVDVDAVVSGMFDMLRRTLGERISIEVAPATGVWPIRVDESQLENAVLNLAINARDAMPNGGMLTIEATNVTLDESSLEDEIEVKPGQYVMLCVTDTGAGMSPEVIERVFEPFFTTKGAAGTGLGLSMVYGFVKQAQGHVRIYSEPGQGTSTKLYLPRLREEGEADRPAELGTQPAPRGSEMILVVEDEPEVRFLCVEALTELGYEVLEAADARNALALLDERSDIALLLTDFGLPDSTGQDLAAEARRRRPGLPVLMATGYGAHAIGRGEAPGAADGIITKPFNSATLGKAVRDVLGCREKGDRATPR